MRASTHIPTALLVATLLLAAGCDDAPTSAGRTEGELCADPLDCRDDLTCLRGRCVEVDEATGYTPPSDDDPLACGDHTQRVTWCIDATTLRICDWDLSGIHDCAPGYCDAGACVERHACSLGATRCAHDEIVACTILGWTALDTCSDDQICVGARCLAPGEPLPDLVVADVRLAASQIAQGLRFELTFTASNIGVGFTDPGQCAVVATSAGQELELAQLPLDPIAPGAETPITLQVPSSGLAPGSVPIHVRCAPYSGGPEDRLDNNAATAGRLAIVIPEHPADLIALWIEPTSPTARPGGAVAFTFALTNAGGTPLEEPRCLFSLEPEGSPLVELGEWRRDDIAPGQELQGAVTFNLSRRTPTGSARVIMACGGLSREGDHGNNHAYTTIQLQDDP